MKIVVGLRQIRFHLYRRVGSRFGVALQCLSQQQTEARISSMIVIDCYSCYLSFFVDDDTPACVSSAASTIACFNLTFAFFHLLLRC